MKELKISISDELYEELSNVPDKDSFLAELIGNELKVSAGDTSEDLPEEAYFELEDTFEEEASIENVEEEPLTLSCDGSLVDPDDLDGCAELFTDIDLEDEVRDEVKPASDMTSFSEEGNIPVENTACFQNIIVDLTDRICELEKQIMDMNSSIQSIKDRSVLFDISDDNVGGQQVSVVQPDNIATERTEENVPYATLSFPDLRVPPELLGDAEVSPAELPGNDTGKPVENVSLDVPDSIVEETSLPEPFSKPLLFDAKVPPLSSQQDSEAGYERELPYFLQGDEVDTGDVGPDSNADVGSDSSKPPVPAENPAVPVPDRNVPITDKLESCIFAYLPSGSEVKKDVIKSLLSKRYADSEVESRIDQLLSDGRIASIVKDDKVYLRSSP
ncbi:hypothetical protein [Methanococcoides methylutens]|uniref:Uncharacterized protein n=1 Tax=Methanococcoides methylutens MM1 TaxID=1434104 RepID=A0A0E3SPG1_METMT|nr:hypothetical protein [Methanococcoides methylutens]AKB84451.1 hypothetical protein MCMEM_0398 [Methanococcoides methylutens MM1]